MANVEKFAVAVDHRVLEAELLDGAIEFVHGIKDAYEPML